MGSLTIDSKEGAQVCLSRDHTGQPYNPDDRFFLLFQYNACVVRSGFKIDMTEERKVGVEVVAWLWPSYKFRL